MQTILANLSLQFYLRPFLQTFEQTCFYAITVHSNPALWDPGLKESRFMGKLHVSPISLFVLFIISLIRHPHSIDFLRHADETRFSNFP